MRLLKDGDAALRKTLAESQGAKEWLKGNADAGFIVALREVTNPSYKRAKILDVGNDNWEVIREVSGEGKDGRRRDSGLEVPTGSKRDVVGVMVRKVIDEGDTVKLGESLGVEFWK